MKKCLPEEVLYLFGVNRNPVNSFGKAFAHVQNCVLEKKAHGTNRIVELKEKKIIDGFYTKTTQKGGFSKLCVKIKK